MPECLVDQKLLLFYLRCKVHLKCSCFWYFLLPQRFVGKHWSNLNLLFCRDVSNLHFLTTSYYFYGCWPLLDLYSSEFLDKWINFWLISFLLFKSFLKGNPDSNSASTSFTRDFKLFGSLCLSNPFWRCLFLQRLYSRKPKGQSLVAEHLYMYCLSILNYQTNIPQHKMLWLHVAEYFRFDLCLPLERGQM